LILIITFKELKISELEKLEVKKEAKESSGKEEISNLLKKVKIVNFKKLALCIKKSVGNENLLLKSYLKTGKEPN